VPLLAVEVVLDLGVLVLLVLGELSLDRRVLVLALAKNVLLDLCILVELALQECCSHAQLQPENTASVSRAHDCHLRQYVYPGVRSPPRILQQFINAAGMHCQVLELAVARGSKDTHIIP